MKVAIFSTYQPSEGFGGPARIFHQRTVLESAGIDVVHVVIQSNATKSTLRSRDLVQLVERPFRAPIDHIYDDVDLGRRDAADPRVVEAVAAHLREHQVDTVMLEQPFLVDLLERVVEQHPARVVYSCQNIEYRLRRDLERFQPNWKRSPHRADEVREIEARAVAMSAVVTAICPSDQQALLAEFGRSSVLVPNGTTLVDAPASARPQASPIDFVFTGSSYWPNVDGFAEIATPSLGFLPPTSRIDVAGTVGKALLEHPVLTRRMAMSKSRLELHGFLSVPDLISLLACARATIVPVFVGEGSNLKSADALGSGIPVIMTRRATHGYEDLIELDPEGVTVVDSAREFRRAMLDALAAPRPDRPVGERRRAELGWQRRLQPLLDALRTAVA